MHYSFTLLTSFFLFPSLAPASLIRKDQSITCLTLGSQATARWKNAEGKTCTWTGIVGSNFGKNTHNGGEYSCNGRCGAGCTGFAIGNVYTQDCFSHDICSWFNNAEGGSRDRNCGAAYNSAIDDTAFGAAKGCGQTNPSYSPAAPNSSPPSCS